MTKPHRPSCEFKRDAFCWGWSSGPSVRKISYRTQTQRQKLLKCKSTIQKATFNVRTLNRMCQLPELTASAIDHNIGIVCVQEHRYHHSEVDIKYHDTNNGWMFVSASAWKNSVNAVIGGVDMLISPRTLKSHNSIEKIQSKMMIATFNCIPDPTIIFYYSPTNVSDETYLDTFFSELCPLVRSIPKHILIISGDMNTK